MAGIDCVWHDRRVSYCLCRKNRHKRSSRVSTFLFEVHSCSDQIESYNPGRKATHGAFRFQLSRGREWQCVRNATTKPVNLEWSPCRSPVGDYSIPRRSVPQLKGTNKGRRWGCHTTGGGGWWVLFISNDDTTQHNPTSGEVKELLNVVFMTQTPTSKSWSIFSFHWSVYYDLEERSHAMPMIKSIDTSKVHEPKVFNILCSF